MSPRQNWDSPNPSLASEFAPSPRTGGRGTHLPVGEGLGESLFRRLEKNLALCLLCAIFHLESVQQFYQNLIFDPTDGADCESAQFLTTPIPNSRFLRRRRFRICVVSIYNLVPLPFRKVKKRKIHGNESQ